MTSGWVYVVCCGATNSSTVYWPSGSLANSTTRPAASGSPPCHCSFMSVATRVAVSRVAGCGPAAGFAADEQPASATARSNNVRLGTRLLNLRPERLDFQEIEVDRSLAGTIGDPGKSRQGSTRHAGRATASEGRPTASGAGAGTGPGIAAPRSRTLGARHEAQRGQRGAPRRPVGRRGPVLVVPPEATTSHGTATASSSTISANSTNGAQPRGAGSPPGSGNG